MALFVLLGGIKANAQTTIGLTQAINTSEKQFEERVATTVDNVAIEVANGSKVSIWDNKGKTACYEGTSYALINGWRADGQGTYTDQWIGYKLTIAEGYKLNITKAEVAMHVEKNNFTSKIVLLDSNGGERDLTSEFKTTNKTTGTVVQTLTETDLTGTIYIKLYVKNDRNSGSAYFVASKLLIDVSVEEDVRATHNVTTSIAEGMGSISPSGTTACVEGSDAVLTATPATGYKFNKWVVDGVESTENPYTISNIVETHTAEAYFTALPVLTFAKPEVVHCVNRMFVSKINTVDVGDKYKLPVNYCYYKEGYTLTGWEIDGTTYNIGDEYTVIGDVTINPVFTANTKSIATRVNAVTVNYDFATATNGDRKINIEGNTDYIITRANVDGEEIDVALHVDATSGKVNNLSGTNRAQVNGGSIFNVYVEEGSTVTYTITNGTAAVDGVTFDGENATSVSGKDIVFNYAGTESKIIAMRDEGKSYYPAGIRVTYPSTLALEVASVTVNGAAVSEEDITTLLTTHNVTVDDIVFTQTPTEMVVTDTHGENHSVALTNLEGSITLDEIEYTVSVDESCLKLIDPKYKNYTVKGTNAPANGSSAVDTEYTIATSTGKYGNFILMQVGGSICLNKQNKVNGNDAIKMGNNRTYQIWNDNENFTITGIKFYGKKATDGEPTFIVTSSNGDAVITSPTNNKIPSDGSESSLMFLVSGGTPQDKIQFEIKSAQAFVNFDIYYEYAQTVTFRDNLASYGPIANVIIPEGVKAYVAREVNGNYIKMEEYTGTVLDETKGYILESANAEAVFTTTTATADGQTDNLLKTTAKGGTVEANTIYVLGKVDDKIAFYNYSGTTMPAYKAYLDKADIPSGAKAVILSFDGDDDGTTAINGIEVAVDAENNEVYNLQGQRVMNPTKGLYIVNGKKVVIK